MSRRVRSGLERLLDDPVRAERAARRPGLQPASSPPSSPRLAALRVPRRPPGAPSSGPSTASGPTPRTWSRSPTRAIRDGPARLQPLRRDARADARACSTGWTRWSSTCRTSAPLLHLHLHDAPRDGGLRARDGKRVIVLDRPNPLGGETSKATSLDPGFRSFVGLHPLPARHGMTVGELALMFRAERGLDVDLRVVRMRGWRRHGLRADGAAVGAALAQHADRRHGLRLSGRLPGRGHQPLRGPRHDAPVRARRRPWLDSAGLARALSASAWPACASAPRLLHAHIPEARGAAVRRRAGARHRSPRASARTSPTCCSSPTRARRRRRFAWRQPPYEYEQVKLPIDILCGTDRIRLGARERRSPRKRRRSWRRKPAATCTTPPQKYCCIE